MVSEAAIERSHAAGLILADHKLQMVLAGRQVEARRVLDLLLARLQSRVQIELDGFTRMADRAFNLINDLAAQRTTIFLCSHLLAEVQQVCTRVSFINRGVIVKEGTTADLLRIATILKNHSPSLQEQSKRLSAVENPLSRQVRR